MYGKKHTPESKRKMSIGQKETATFNYDLRARVQYKNIKIFKKPNGEQFKVYNVSNFCHENGLSRKIFKSNKIGKINIDDISKRAKNIYNTLGWEFNSINGLISPDNKTYFIHKYKDLNLSPRILRQNKDNGVINLDMIDIKYKCQINSIGWEILN